jgi:hypothetical protein
VGPGHVISQVGNAQVKILEWPMVVTTGEMGNDGSGATGLMGLREQEYLN